MKHKLSILLCLFALQCGQVVAYDIPTNGVSRNPDFICLTAEETSKAGIRAFAGAASSEEDSYEYWFDGDYDSRQASAFAGDSLALSINISNLTPGLHTFNFRAIGPDNTYGTLARQMFYFAPELAIATSEVAAYELWFDSDYTSRQSASLSDNALALSIDISGLTPGLHTFNFRPIGQGNAIGSLTRQAFFFAPELSVATWQLAAYETWFDSDYSHRRRVSHTSGEIVCQYDLSALAPGLHTFNFRPIGQGNAIGSLTRQVFFYAPELSVATWQLAGYELWLDGDYGHRRSEPYTDSEIVCQLDLSALAPGLHTFNFRPIGQGGAIGALTRQLFYLAPDEDVYARRCRYSFDEQPDTVYTDVSGDNFAMSLDISDLSQGPHVIYMSFMNAAGKWGPVHTEEFTIYGEPLSDDEWNYLQALWQELSDMGWTAPWNLSAGSGAASTFEGVRMEDGHITGFDFSKKNLTGLFPQSIFLFPHLRKLDMSHNNLSGGIDKVFAAATTIEGAVYSLQNLNLSHNAYSGNVGALAYALPSLTNLNVSYNCFADITPAISESVATLNYAHQDIDRIVEIDFAKLDRETVAKTIPTLTLYNHALQTWVPTNEYVLTTAPVEGFTLGGTDDWTIALGWDEFGPTMPYVSEEYYIYYGQSGDVVNAIMMLPDATIEGTNFRVRIMFSDGDVNFDGSVNVMDLQSVINFIFEIYNASNVKPFNFTAADLTIDEHIDIRDAVLLVNALLAQTSNAQSAPARVRAAIGDGRQLAFNLGGELCLSADRPIAAFELTLEGEDDVELSPSLKGAGFVCETQRHSNGTTRLVGYSLSGATLPAGTTAIGTIGKAAVTSALLCDADANAITKAGQATGVSHIAERTETLNIAYEDGTLNVNCPSAMSGVTWSVYAADGTLLRQGRVASLKPGVNAIACGILPDGVAVVTIEADGQAPQRSKTMIVNR